MAAFPTMSSSTILLKGPGICLWPSLPRDDSTSRHKHHQLKFLARACHLREHVHTAFLGFRRSGWLVVVLGGYVFQNTGGDPQFAPWPAPGLLESPAVRVGPARTRRKGLVVMIRCSLGCSAAPIPEPHLCAHRKGSSLPVWLFSFFQHIDH